MSKWDEEARALGASHSWLVKAAPSEVKAFVEREWRLRTQPDPHSGGEAEPFDDSTLSRWVMRDSAHG